ncbi:MAG: cytochrome-c peroxidase [Acidobacteria bacterium]|nr:MAG: cytochrome-c peroxidase [Acidobacteriota bacterium]
MFGVSLWKKLGLVCGPLIASSALLWAQMPSHVHVPKDNPLTPAKIELGKKLFFDPRISITGTVSCNSCHNVMTNGTDNRPVSAGAHGELGDRNAPTVFNSAFRSVQFWDGRAGSLEDQAKGPPTNPVEMGMPSGEAIAERIRAIPGYRQQFAEVFGGSQPITYDHIAQAIASFERTLTTPGSAYDHFMSGDKTALSPAAQRGLKLMDSVGCTGCHSGPQFSGPEQPMGTGFYMKFPMNSDNAYVTKYNLAADIGRKRVTHRQADEHMFVVQSLRNVELTAPYFHNGSVKTLDEAVRVMASAQLGQTLTVSQVQDIVAFLDSLTGEFPQIALPRLPETPNTTLLEK